MPNYSSDEIKIEECEKEFRDTLTEVGTRREGMDRLLQYLGKTDFFRAPAGLDGFESREGGLLRHSLNVFSRIIFEAGNESVLCSLGEESTRSFLDSMTICSLLSGIWKADYYKKVSGENEPDRYEIRPLEERQLCFGRDDDHGDEAVYMLQSFFKLKRREAQAIRCQDWDPKSPETGRIFAKNPLALLLYSATMKAKYFDEIDRP